MSRRFIHLFLGGVLALALPSCRANTCPLCGGGLTRVGDVADDQARPSKNLAVWNRSICGNPFYGNDSKICSQCWHAYSEAGHCWERSSELADSFRRPLCEEIRRFPVPASGDIKSPGVYSQRFMGTQVTESVSFWCTRSARDLRSFRDYAQQHDLTLRVEEKQDIPNEVYVAVEAKPKQR